jgi:hypothetical protein
MNGPQDRDISLTHIAFSTTLKVLFLKRNRAVGQAQTELVDFPIVWESDREAACLVFSEAPGHTC